MKTAEQRHFFDRSRIHLHHSLSLPGFHAKDAIGVLNQFRCEAATSFLGYVKAGVACNADGAIEWGASGEGRNTCRLHLHIRDMILPEKVLEVSLR